MKFLKKQDPKIYQAIAGELKRQQDGLELIASENYVSEAVLEALGSVLTNKYAEGYPGKRYYGGQFYVDQIESLAIKRAKKLFGAEHANVQPHSGAQANLIAYGAVMKLGDKILGMDLSHGGHLTHGHPLTLPAQIYRFVSYKTTPAGEIDYEDLEKIAVKEKPKMILAGFSSYTRQLNYEKFQAIAQKVGAISMMDMAHIAGLVAGKVISNPIPYFDIVTTTTHKTLRGPRGGMILCKKEFAAAIDRAAFPGVQGGPHEHTIAAKAVALSEAMRPDFRRYAKQILKNAKALEIELKKFGFKIVFGETENHMVLLDAFGSNGLTGKEAQVVLEDAGITTNKNVIPDDPRGPTDPSGIRLGVPAVTTRGMKEKEMRVIARLINETLENSKDKNRLAKIKKETKAMCRKFPIYKKLKQ